MKDILDLDGDAPVIEVKLGGVAHEIRPMEFEIAFEAAMQADESAQGIVEAVRKISGIPELTPDQALALLGCVKNYVIEAGQGKKKQQSSPGSPASTGSPRPKRRS